jgi:hypothetical protein
VYRGLVIMIFGIQVTTADIVIIHLPADSGRFGLWVSPKN